jgi:hypothetical protein
MPACPPNYYTVHAACPSNYYTEHAACLLSKLLVHACLPAHLILHAVLACPPNFFYMPACLLTDCLCLFFVSDCIFLSPFLCLFICLSVYLPVFLSVWIRDAVMQILIPLFTLMRIRTRIWILIKVIKSAITGERPGPSIAPFEHPQLLNIDSDSDPDSAFLAKMIRIGCGSGHCFLCLCVCLSYCLPVCPVELACMETDVPIINRLKVYLNI